MKNKKLFIACLIAFFASVLFFLTRKTVASILFQGKTYYGLTPIYRQLFLNSGTGYFILFGLVIIVGIVYFWRQAKEWLLKQNLTLLLLAGAVTFMSATNIIPLGHTTISWVNVVDYGAKGDGTTDATAGFRAAKNALSSTAGVFYIPTGLFLISDSIAFPKTVTVQGSGGIGEQLDSATAGKLTRYPPTTILFSAGAKNCIVINADDSQSHDFCIVSTSSSTPTSSHLILVNNGVGYRQTNVSLYYGYENEHIVSGYNRKITGCYFGDPVNWNFVLDNPLPAAHPGDAGDDVVSDCWFFSGSTSTNKGSHFLWLSAGGLKVSNLKFNQNGGNMPLHCIYAPLKYTTADFSAVNCSFENYKGYGIGIIPASGVAFTSTLIVGCQFNSHVVQNTGFSNIQIGADGQTISNVTVVGCDFYNQGLGSNTGTYPTTVYTNYNVITTGTHVTIGPNTTLAVGTQTGYDNYLCTGGFTANINIIRSNQRWVIPSATTALYDFSNGVNQFFTMTSNATLNVANQGYCYGKLIVTQNATGGWLLNSGGAHIIGSISQINPAPNSITIIEIAPAYDGAGYTATIQDWRTTDVGNLAGQTTTGTIKAITSSAANATYNISGYLNIASGNITTDVVQYQITYTDENNVSQTISGPNISTASNNAIPLTQIRVKASTTITVKSNLTTTGGTITMDEGATIAQVN